VKRELEFWASPEPTIARIDAERYRDQRAETGHLERDDDIALLRDLGIHATRYPVLWESCAPERPDARSYAWESRRLALLNRAGIEPIVTLLHHGSGPRYTSLVDPSFPELFAAYAAATAREFPWIRRWTPVNEPLTTARFATLYGVWYPNLRDERAFGRALVHETLGFLLAAARIADIIPGAEFMVTEDLQSFASADAPSQAYAEFKRQRSFLSIDMLCGRVDRAHPLWDYLVRACDVSSAALDRVRSLARPPDMLGWNYYPNSERALRSRPDGSIENRPLRDATLARLDPRALLRAAWTRYRLPLALSEVHVAGSELERVRWLMQRYDDVTALRSEGVDVRAFGAWAAFGMVDWSSLLRDFAAQREDGVYTCAPGGEPPVPTLVAEALHALCRGTRPRCTPVEGWWEHSA